MYLSMSLPLTLIFIPGLGGLKNSISWRAFTPPPGWNFMFNDVASCFTAMVGNKPFGSATDSRKYLNWSSVSVYSYEPRSIPTSISSKTIGGLLDGLVCSAINSSSLMVTGASLGATGTDDTMGARSCQVRLRARQGALKRDPR